MRSISPSDDAENPGDHDSPTSFPFGFSAEDYALALENVPTRDLLADIETGREDRSVWDLLADHEASCWRVLGTEDDLGPSNAVAQMQADRLEAKIRVAADRRRLIERHSGHPYAPPWPQKDERRRERVEAVKSALTMESFCRDHLGVDLRASGDRLKGRCPFPGHNDGSPSFYVFPDESSWCFGCNRGGDLIETAKSALNSTSFYEALSALERAAGIGGAR